MTPTVSFKYSLQNPRTQDVFQSIVKGRKSWKTLRGGEVVWPPELEAALIEGLENYQPDDSRETRLLGRFPMRNRFISDWIFEKTGKRRTAKQVGSRLQQLRDTCGGKRLLTLLSPIRRRRPYRSTSLSPEFHHKEGHLAYGQPPLRCESDSSSDSSASAPTTPTEAHATLKSLLYHGVESREEVPSSVVYIDLLHSNSSSNDNGPYWAPPGQVAEERLLVEHGHKIVRATHYPRQLRDIDPTITLLSKSVINATSYFTVHLEDRVIYSESTTLEQVESATSNVDGILYKTSLVPGLWDTITRSSDASQYTISQRVVRDPSSSSPSGKTIFSATYKFAYQTSTPTEQNFAIPHVLTTEEAFEQNGDFCLESLLSIEDDAYSDVMGFVKSSDFFDLDSMDFAMTSDSWSGQCSPDQSAFPSPSQYPQSMLGVVPNENEYLLPPACIPTTYL